MFLYFKLRTPSNICQYITQMKLIAILLACMLTFCTAQVCGESAVPLMETGLVELGVPTASFAQTQYIITFQGSLGTYDELFSAFAIAGFQGACSQTHYALTVDQIYFENLNTKMRFTMDYVYDNLNVTSTTKWTKVKLTYIVVSTDFEDFTAAEGGNYVWAGSIQITVDTTGTKGLYKEGSIFSDKALDVVNTCGYLNGQTNQNTPKFDTNCAANDQIVPHFYIMGFQFLPGTFQLGAQAKIPNYLTALSTAVIFGSSLAQGFGPLVDINQFSNGLKKMKVGIVLTTLRNYASYPNTDQDFSYSSLYTAVTLFNVNRPMVRGTTVGTYNRNRYEIPKLTNQIYGLASFSIDKLSTNCTSVDVNVEVKDLYSIIVQTDNIDQLKNVFIAADFFTKNTNDLCGVTSPATEMVDIKTKHYITVPDLVELKQNIKQTATTPMTWELTGFTVANGSQLITYNVTLDFENFTPGKGYRFTTSLIQDTNWDTTFAGIASPYIRYVIEIDGVIVNDHTIVKDNTTGFFPDIFNYNFGISIQKANPRVRFIVTIPRPTGADEFDSDITLKIEEYDVLYNPITDCCVPSCPAGSGINILSNPPACIVCQGDNSLVFNAGTGVCTCKTGFYNIISDSTTGRIVCFPCLANLCSTCAQATPAQCSTCLVGAAFDTAQKCQCTTGYFQVNGTCATCPVKCATCSVNGACNTCSDLVNRNLNANCNCTDGFYDAGVAKCATCNPICKTCSNATTCTSCFTENNRTLVNGQCLCASGFYQFIDASNQITCRKCNAECQECTGPTLCQDCDASKNRIIGYDEIGYKTCYCAPGYSALSNGDCRETNCKADPFCQECDVARNVTICIQCLASTNRVLSIPQYTCLCKEGYYENNGVCVPCQSGCAKCSNATICERCAVSATNNNNGSCACPSSYFFAVEPLRFCKRCNDFCLNCTNSLSCSLCLPGFSATTNGKCECPRGNYVNAQLQCVACIGNCNLCTSSTNCTLCNPGYLLQDGQCVTRCNPGKFASGVQCLNCSEGCSFCATATSCIVCAAGRFAYNGKCEINCPAGSISNLVEQTCTACNAPCATCVQHPSKCLSCTTGNYFEFACHANCPVGTYNDNGICKYCSFECASCLGSENTCIACPTGKFLFESKCYDTCPIALVNGRCPNLCPSGFFTSSSNSCLKCNDKCKTCDNRADFCTSCVTGLALNGTCVTACPSNTLSLNGKCQACISGCATCSGSIDKCVTCASGFLLSGTRCIVECGTGSYYDSANNLCRKCNSTCSACTGASFCTACTNPLSQPINGVCFDCIFPCSKCTTFESCTACQTGFNLFNNRCTSSCPAGSTATNGVCRCATGAFQNGACVAQCAPGFTNINGVCTACVGDCAECSGTTATCTSCASGFVLNTVTSKCEVNTNCQPGEYFRSETRRCTRICPIGLSFQLTVCVSECLDGFRDNGFGACVEQKQVTGCSFPYFYQDQCVSSCSAGSFPNSANRVCEACSSNCFSCMSSAFCTSCRSGYDLKDGICIVGKKCTGTQLKYNGVCLNNCPPGTILSTNGYCERRCGPNSYFYLNKCYTVCPAATQYRTDVACVSACPENYILEGTVCRLSTQTCPSGEFYNAQTGACAACTFPCTQCQFTQSYCTACGDGQTLSGNRCIASNSCASGTYRGTNGQCQQCPAKCAQCVSATECSTCATGYIFNGFDCVLRLANLKEVAITQSSIFRRNNTVFIGVSVSIIPNGLTADQLNNFFVVIPSTANKIVRVNQWKDATQTLIWVAIEYETFPAVSTVFLALNAEKLGTALANVGYTASENSFLSVIVSTSIAPAAATLQIPATSTNSLSKSLTDVPLANKALAKAIKQTENIIS